MAQFFTNWDFDKGVSQGLERAQRKAERKEQVRQFDKGQAFREKELAERIVARKAVDELRERQLAEQIKGREQRVTEARKTRDFQMGETEKVRDFQGDQADKKYEQTMELYEMGKTKEERQQKKLDRAMLSNLPTFEEYDQNEAVTEMQDFLGFDEGEFRRAADSYIGDVQKNLPNLLSVIEKNPNDPQAMKHIDDLRQIKEVLDGGEYSGPLDSTVFDWFDGEASDAKKSSARIDRIISAYDSMTAMNVDDKKEEGVGFFDNLFTGDR